MTALSPAVSNPVITPDNRLVGKVALITGGTRGIGLAVAKAYLREGAKVIITGRNASTIKETVKTLSSIGGDVVGLRADLEDATAAENIFSGAARAFGKVNILVNNAAMLGPRKTITETDPDQWRRVVEINLNGLFLVTRGVLGMMVPGNTGSVINVSSSVGRKGRAEWGAYAVTKGAMETLTQVLAEEMAPYRIRVNSLNPGGVRTDMRAEAFPAEDPGVLNSPDDIVNAFIYLAADVSRGVTGQQIEATDWMGRQF